MPTYLNPNFNSYSTSVQAGRNARYRAPPSYVKMADLGRQSAEPRTPFGAGPYPIRPTSGFPYPPRGLQDDGPAGTPREGPSLADGSDQSCVQILNHVKNCPICRYVFSPHESILNAMPSHSQPRVSSSSSGNLKIEISQASFFIVIALFIVLTLLLASGPKVRRG